jgi:peptide/nickel transport system permease protein
MIRRLPVELVLGLILSGALLVALALYPGAFEAARDVDLSMRLAPPGPGGLIGADQLGRDLLARVLAGAPWSLGTAAGATAIALVLGSALGLAAAEAPGWPRAAILQAANLALSFPGLVAAVACVAVFGQGGLTVVLVLGFLTWALFARVVYAESLAVLTRDYVTAARLGGVRPPQVLWRHVLPAIRPSLIAMSVFHFADMLVAAGALSFLGVGAPLGAPAWGAMLAESRPYLYLAPWMLAAPAIALAGTVLGLNLVGDGLSKLLALPGRARIVR